MSHVLEQPVQFLMKSWQSYLPITEAARRQALLQLKSIYNWDNFEITDQTLLGLVDEGFTSLLSISSIREDDLKYLKKSAGITQGQVALLRQAVADISSTTISTCRALVQSISTLEPSPDQGNNSIEVTFQAGAVGTGSPSIQDQQEAGCSEPAVLECRSVSPEGAGTSGQQVKIIPCSIVCDSPSSSSESSSSSN